MLGCMKNATRGPVAGPLVAILVLLAACASSGRVGERQELYGRYEQIYMSALRAVNQMGGRIVTENRSSGVIVGQLDVDTLGGAVRLNITVDRPPTGGDADPRRAEYVTVKVRASEPGGSTDDAEREVELQRLEQQYLQLVGGR